MQGFANDYPFIRGALLDLLVEVLKELPNVKLKQMPRMADFLKLGTALEKIIHLPNGSFLSCYEENQKQCTVMAIEHLPAIVALMQYMSGTKYFEGTYKDLLRLLNIDKPTYTNGWPASEIGLSRLLKRQAPALKLVGLQINFSDKYYADSNADTSTIIKKLHEQVKKVSNGDMSRSEIMLMTHAQTLDAVFHKMMKTAMRSDLLNKLQVYADLGFKAQNQCRKALLALAEIRNPKRATFIKQQNNAVNQQVNNGINSKNLKKN